ncbi:DivIVA domain-containing protein [Marisediminicola antarctica]|uniref:Cell wall synthesis protein Wag31 n=1 Tax=Marisediminicola antarctica TaxID=674079 RepID=A0A7L5ALI3_9MICO|nr:DivIVA domain-containing protein [Marisediminicola antarctica]QHO70184.1 cell division protein [Marisediminicola antarctica]
MALTPEDVVNKRFQPTKFREGYDQDEVDDFLDEVVVELRRLTQENEELRQRLVGTESRMGEMQRGAGEPAAADEPVVAPAPEPEPEVVAPAAVAAPVAYAAPSVESETESTTNLLQLARRLHEEHVREGVEKRESLVAEGNATAERVVSEAEATAAKVVGEAESNADRVVTEAEATAARLVTEAEATQRAQLAKLDEERTDIEQRIDELRTFEREYRQKLKGYIESQLRELDTAGSASKSEPASISQGVGGN